MESNTFINVTIYIHFRNEYFSSKKNLWKTFIDSKDLGVICLSYLNKTSCIDPSLDRYEIIDEKKWLISKLKYGF